MFEYIIGNIVLEKTEALVNAVNCVGEMGRGVALAFKNEFASNYRAL